MTTMTLNVLKVFAPATVAFFVGIFLAPILTHYLYKYKAWRKDPRSNEENSMGAAFNKIHNTEAETSTPRMGGILIWVSALVTILFFWIISKFFSSESIKKLDFLSRSQTWIPLFTLISGSLVGLIDDILQINGNYENKKHLIEGLSLRNRVLFVFGISSIGAWWFFFKLGMSAIHVPFIGNVELGILFIPFFMIIMVAVFSGSIIDGIDGLSGGVMSFAFLAYMGIALMQNQVDLAAFCALVAGSTLAFLWFNIPPARFYMGETGMLGLTLTLTTVAFLANAVAVLPIIALPLFAASGSAIIQRFSKKYFNKKVFLIAPIHHHFQALGWPSAKVTMRFWVISIIFSIIGMMLSLF